MSIINYENRLPHEHIEHLTLLRALFQALIEVTDSDKNNQTEAACGAADVADRIAKLIHPAGHFVLSHDGNNVNINPELFAPILNERLNELQLAYYNAGLHTMHYQMQKLYPPK